LPRPPPLHRAAPPQRPPSRRHRDGTPPPACDPGARKSAPWRPRAETPPQHQPPSEPCQTPSSIRLRRAAVNHTGTLPVPCHGAHHRLRRAPRHPLPDAARDDRVPFHALPLPRPGPPPHQERRRGGSFPRSGRGHGLPPPGRSRGGARQRPRRARAPLPPVGEVALASPQTSEEYRGDIQDMLDLAKRMQAMVEKLLLLARLEAGQIAPSLHRIDLTGVASGAVGNAAERLQARRVVFHKRGAPGEGTRVSYEGLYGPLPSLRPQPPRCREPALRLGARVLSSLRPLRTARLPPALHRAFPMPPSEDGRCR